MTKVEETKVEVITETDLLKAIKDLETAPIVKTDEVKPEPKVETTALAKSTADVLKGGSDGLRKVLDVSETLREVVGLIGTHVDSVIQPMEKSIQAGAERDLAIVRVLADLKKSIDANTLAITKFGEVPGAAKTPETTTAKSEILAKSLNGKQEPKPADASEVKRQVSRGLEILAKSFKPGSQENQDYMRAAIQFESTGKITDQMLSAAKQAMTPKAA